MKEWGGKAVAPLLAALASVSLMWMTVAANTPTREEVRTLIAAESPYVRDAEAIRWRLGEIHKAVGENTKKLDRLLAGRMTNATQNPSDSRP